MSTYAQDAQLIDISGSGACLRMRSPHASEDLLAFVVRWNEETILLRGRVVRSAVERSWSIPDVSLARVDHHVGVEFFDLPPKSVVQLERLTAQ